MPVAVVARSFIGYHIQPATHFQVGNIGNSLIAFKIDLIKIKGVLVKFYAYGAPLGFLHPEEGVFP